MTPDATTDRVGLATEPLVWTPEAPVQVRHSLGGSPFCVPAALSALTGLTTLETTNLLKEHWFGDTQVKGVFYPAALKVLGVLGYQYQEWGFLEKGGLYLLVLPGHCAVWYDGKLFDNSHPTGTDNGSTWKRRIEKIFRIWK